MLNDHALKKLTNCPKCRCRLGEINKKCRDCGWEPPTKPPPTGAVGTFIWNAVFVICFVAFMIAAIHALVGPPFPTSNLGHVDEDTIPLVDMRSKPYDQRSSN